MQDINFLHENVMEPVMDSQTTFYSIPVIMINPESIIMKDEKPSILDSNTEFVMDILKDYNRCTYETEITHYNGIETTEMVLLKHNDCAGISISVSFQNNYFPYNEQVASNPLYKKQQKEDELKLKFNKVIRHHLIQHYSLHTHPEKDKQINIAALGYDINLFSSNLDPMLFLFMNCFVSSIDKVIFGIKNPDTIGITLDATHIITEENIKKDVVKVLKTQLLELETKKRIEQRKGELK